MNRRASGLTVVEVLVALAILAILGAALVGVLPSLARNTRASTTDTQLSQVVSSIFEAVGNSWTLQTSYSAGEVLVGGTSIDVGAHVQAETGGACTAQITPLPSVAAETRRRLVITCAADGNLPERSLRAEYGAP